MSITCAGSKYLSITTPLVTTTPFSFSCWFKSSTFTANQILFTVGNATISEAFYIFVALTTRVISVTARSSSTSSTAATSTAATSGAWNHAGGAWASSISRSAYLNGGGKGTNTTSTTPGTMTATRIGENIDTTSPMIGQIAFLGLWSVALSDSEFTALSNGASPRLVQPSKLIEYNRLSSSTFTGMIYPTAWTIVGTPTLSDNPLIYTP